jgi:hypothetical protein
MKKFGLFLMKKFGLFLMGFAPRSNGASPISKPCILHAECKFAFQFERQPRKVSGQSFEFLKSNLR